MFKSILIGIGRAMARYLTSPMKGFVPLSTGDAVNFHRVLQPGDIVLIEGNTRIATAIKYLTQSTWSHAALYTGPIGGRADHEGVAHDMVEVLVNEGVVSGSIAKYAETHTRICRPTGLKPSERRAMCTYVISRLGQTYDLGHIIDLARYFLPTPPVPSRWRRGMLALGAGSPTQAICSSLLAEAFGHVGYPILPIIPADASKERLKLRNELAQIASLRLFVPRDFDISPYFAVIKPTLEAKPTHGRNIARRQGNDSS